MILKWRMRPVRVCSSVSAVRSASRSRSIWIRERRRFFVLGAGRSGRSTALATALESVRRGRPGGSVYVLTPRPSPLRADTAGWAEVASTQEQIDRSLQAFRVQAEAGEHPVLVIDDAEALPASAGEPVAHPPPHERVGRLRGHRCTDERPSRRHRAVVALPSGTPLRPSAAGRPR